MHRCKQFYINKLASFKFRQVLRLAATTGTVFALKRITQLPRPTVFFLAEWIPKVSRHKSCCNEHLALPDLMRQRHFFPNNSSRVVHQHEQLHQSSCQETWNIRGLDPKCQDLVSTPKYLGKVFLKERIADADSIADSQGSLGRYQSAMQT